MTPRLVACPWAVITMDISGGRGRICFVTGATGFVALNLVDELLANGWQVHALHREGSQRASMLKQLPHADSRLNLVPGDLKMDHDKFVLLVPSDTDVIFHICHLEESKLHPARKLSASGFQPEGADEHKLVNQYAMANVISAAKARSVRRVVYCSSWSSYGRQPGGTDVTEATKSLAHEHIDASCCCCLGAKSSPVPYFECKLALEDQLRKAATAGSSPNGRPDLPPERNAMTRGDAGDPGTFEVVVIQPCSVFGRFGDTGWCLIFEKLLETNGNMPGLPGASSFVDVQDLAAAFVSAADARPGVPCQRFIVGGTNATNFELQHAMAKLVGTPAPTRPTPPVVLVLLSRWNECLLGVPVCRWLRVLPGTIGSPWLVAKITQNQSTDSAAAQAALGYRPRPLASTLKRNYNWLVSSGTLPSKLASKKSS